MSHIAKVVVDIALDREFDYLVPDALLSRVALGSRVEVPFGRRSTHGYVVGLADRSSFPRLKAIYGLAADRPLVTERIMDLARWMAGYYCAPVELAIRTVLPGAVRRAGARHKQRLYVTLARGSSVEDEGAPLPRLSPKQAALLAQLDAAGGSMALSELTRALGVTAAPVRSLAEKGLVAIASAPVLRDPLANRTILPTQPLALMPEQAAALALIRQAADTLNPSVVLLNGVTGSGKTEVYLQAIDYVLKQGRSAIVLVPEIALTPQTVERFVGRFGNRIAVLHSHLSDGERYDEWHRIREGKADIVVGARSAVFAPACNLGLIVVDEEHEPSYKQEESPRYNARDVAVMRGRIEKCAVVLGSATPSLESTHNAALGKYRLTRLPRRADNCKLPRVQMVDMRVEAERTGGASVFSRPLVEAIRLRIERAEQTMLFLNRRGFATSLLCPKCGFVAVCGQCSVSCTYHRADDTLRCHICGDCRPSPAKCPSCGDPAFKFTGVGTQRVEAIVQKLFPHARFQRMDADTVSGKNSYDRILGDFRAGKTDILIGTQMIAKGLHFPNVTLVGVIYADLSLHMADFRAGERTFQLLAQVAGRAGRGEVPGEVIVQTFTPFHAAVQAARRLDYDGFCDQEMEFRRELKYPPFAHLLCITLKGPSESKVAFCAAALQRKIGAHASEHVMLSDATPAPLARAKGLYRYQIMMRCASVRAMTSVARAALQEVKLPPEINCAVDVDALDLM